MASEEAERDVAAAELAAAVAAAWEEGGLAALLGDSQPPSALTRCVGVTPGVRKVPCGLARECSALARSRRLDSRICWVLVPASILNPGSMSKSRGPNICSTPDSSGLVAFEYSRAACMHAARLDCRG